MAERDVFIVAGGVDRNDEPIYSVERCFPHQGRWAQVQWPMLTDRHDFALCALGGCVFVVGGLDESEDPDAQTLKTVEQYVVATHTWRPVAPMCCARQGPRGCAVPGAGSVGRIYALGGFNADGVTLSSVEYYDPATNTWTMSRAVPDVPRSYGAAVALEDAIYVRAYTHPLPCTCAAHDLQRTLSATPYLISLSAGLWAGWRMRPS